MYHVKIDDAHECDVTISNGKWESEYAVESWSDVTDSLLYTAARRKMGLPLFIASTPRLIIRELTLSDLPALKHISQNKNEQILLGEDDSIFTDRAGLSAYIKNYYPLWNIGIWGIEEKRSGLLIGKAGLSVSNCTYDIDAPELGFHISREFRNCGYAFEACRAIITYALEELDMHALNARCRSDNDASVSLLKKLGFTVYKNQKQTDKDNDTSETLVFHL